jgi:hypothetical protein
LKVPTSYNFNIARALVPRIFRCSQARFSKLSLQTWMVFEHRLRAAAQARYITRRCQGTPTPMELCFVLAREIYLKLLEPPGTLPDMFAISDI